MVFSQMLSNAAGTEAERTPISGEWLKELQETFVHIADLKPGDKVKWKNRFLIDSISPDLDEVVEVFRLLDKTNMPKGEIGSINECTENDFSVAFIVKGKIVEYAFDSRRFMRA